jgi:ATP-dependent Zn protease
MSDLGVTSYASLNQGYINSYSNKTSLKIDTEVRKLVDECYNEVETLLKDKSESIEA